MTSTSAKKGSKLVNDASGIASSLVHPFYLDVEAIYPNQYYSE